MLDLAPGEYILVEKCALPRQEVLFAAEDSGCEVVPGHDVADHHGEVIADAVGYDLKALHGLIGLLPITGAVGGHVEEVAVEAAAGAGRQRYDVSSEVDERRCVGNLAEL